jgi:ubiquinone/menaquinone biosynthesis C-methylase UbiE
MKRGRLLPLVDHFTFIAPYYDQFCGQSDADDLIGYLEPQPGQRVLDVGGGTGRVAEQLAGLATNVCVLDPSTGMVLEGQRKGICVIQGEAEALPYIGDVFDRILMVDAFHHLRDQPWAAREMVRVLAPGGRVVIEEPDITHLGVRLVALGEKLLLMRSQFRTPQFIQRLFQMQGARVRVERRAYTAWIIVEKAQPEAAGGA